MDIAIQDDDLRHTRDTVLGCIAEDTGQPVGRVEAGSRRDRWFLRSWLDEGEVHPCAPGQVDDREVKSTGERLEHLRGRVLLAALELGEVLRRQPGTTGNVRDALTTELALPAQLAPVRAPPPHGAWAPVTRRRHTTYWAHE